MMEHTDGMIILNQYEVGGHDFLLFLSIVMAIVIVVIGVFAVRDRRLYSKWDGEAILYFVGAIICFGIVFSGWLIPQINSYMIYEVYFTEDASLQEFLEEYEIISREGEIYTIRRKE